MKKIIITSILSIITLLSFAQSNTYFHDRIDTTIFVIADTVGHGANNYFATNNDPNFNIAKYQNGLLINVFIKHGNSGTSTFQLHTRTGTLPKKTIENVGGLNLLTGDLKDSSIVTLTYYNNRWRCDVNGHANANNWLLLGNSGTTANTNFVGTTDAQDVVFKRNSSEAMRISTSSKNIGIGTSTPTVTLTVNKSGVGDVVHIDSANTNKSSFDNRGRLTIGRSSPGDALIECEMMDDTSNLGEYMFAFKRYNEPTNSQWRMRGDGYFEAFNYHNTFYNNVGIGVINPDNARLYVKGATSTSPLYAIAIENSTPTILFSQRNDGLTTINPIAQNFLVTGLTETTSITFNAGSASNETAINGNFNFTGRDLHSLGGDFTQLYNNNAVFNVYTDDPFAINWGASIAMGGRYDATHVTNFGAIQFAKANNTSGNQLGYMIFGTNSGANMAEAGRFTSTQDFVITTGGIYMKNSISNTNYWKGVLVNGVLTWTDTGSTTIPQ